MNPTPSSELGVRLASLCQSMDKESPDVMRCVRIYRVEAHPQRKILMILGTVVITVVTPNTGFLEVKPPQDFKKPVHLVGLNRSSKSEQVALDIISNYPLTDDSMLHQLTDIIEEIKQRDYDQNGIAMHRQLAPDGTFLPRNLEIFEDFDLEDDVGFDRMTDEEPDFGKLDHYIELLYEDIPQKVEASHYLCNLIKTNNYLEDVAKHDSAINAIFRTLREDSKKSTQLTKNIMWICLTFAKTKDFQDLLVKHKIPLLTLDIIDFELERCEKWKTQIKALEESAIQKNTLSSRVLTDYHAMWTRLDELSTFQNSLLKISFEVLHCTSEIVSVREILYENKVVTSLADSLDRRDNDLLEVVTSYLSTLSCFRQFVDQIYAVQVIEKLARILKAGFPIPKRAINNCLHLLYNLSFDNDLRESIIQSGIVAIISNLLSKSQFQEIICKIFYNLSLNSSARSQMAKTSVIKPLMTILTASDEARIPNPFGSLAVNLSRNRKCAEKIWETNKLSQLIKNALKQEDFMAMKIIRNLAEHDAAFVLYEFVGEISSASLRSCDQDFVIECIGALANFDTAKVDFEILTQKGRLFPSLKETLTCYLEKVQGDLAGLTSGMKLTTSDVLLLLANISCTEEGARVVVGEGFADTLIKILHSVSPKETTIIDLVFYVFAKATSFESISIYFAVKTRIPTGLLEYAESASGTTRKSCVAILEQIGLYDDTWKENMQQFHFLSWNKQWTNQMTLGGPENDSNSDSDTPNPEQIAEASLYTFQDFGSAREFSKTGSFGERSYSSGSGSEGDDCRVGVNFPEYGADEETMWLCENERGYFDSGIMGLFRQQFEEEMALKKRMTEINLRKESFSDYLESSELDFDDDEMNWQ